MSEDDSMIAEQAYAQQPHEKAQRSSSAEDILLAHSPAAYRVIGSPKGVFFH